MKRSTEQNGSAARRLFYKWHRILGLTALVPVIFWSLSGLSHPFMSNWFRPAIPQETFKPALQSEIKPTISLQEVMDKNGLTTIRNFALVKFDAGTFYQVLNQDSIYNYYSTKDGKLLPNGDKAYATYLARYFTQDSTSAIKNITLQTSFDSHYQPINRLLPVWKVSFDRADGMDVYIETTQSRMGTFNNNTRKTFLWLFEQFHTWQFLADIGGEQFRVIVLMVIVSIMLLSLLSGLTVYGLFWNRFKEIQQKRKAKGADDKRFVHRYHRQIGLVISTIMFMFLVSGGFHLYMALRNSAPAKAGYQQLINRSDLEISNLKLPVADSAIIRIGLVNLDGHTYYQVQTNKKQVRYIDAKDANELTDGDKTYAVYLANYYHTPSTEPEKVYRRVTATPIKQFTNDYGFINKRLPVQQIQYPDGDWYVETTTSHLATKVTAIDRAEGLSFIFLHKFFWMTWAGKDIRDIVSIVSALAILLVSLLGFTAFIKNK
jgi:hypothetical protein